MGLLCTFDPDSLIYLFVYLSKEIIVNEDVRLEKVDA